MVDRLDDDLSWLETLGVRWVATGTERPLTTGVRVDPRQVVELLATRVEARCGHALQLRTSIVDARRFEDGGIQLCVREHRGGALPDAPDRWQHYDAVVFAGGGYAGSFDRIEQEAGLERGSSDSWRLRPARCGSGTSMDVAIRLGAARLPATGECLVRIVPAVDEHVGPRALARFGSLLVPGVELLAGQGPAAPRIERASHDWSGAMACWELARRGVIGQAELPRAVLRARVHGVTIEQVVREAVDAGATAGRRPDGSVWINVAAGITHTRCGLRVDADGRLLQRRVSGLRRRVTTVPLPGCFAAGCDAAGTGLGGVASGLAQALVLGRAAGRAAALDA